MSILQRTRLRDCKSVLKQTLKRPTVQSGLSFETVCPESTSLLSLIWQAENCVTHLYGVRIRLKHGRPTSGNGGRRLRYGILNSRWSLTTNINQSLCRCHRRKRTLSPLLPGRKTGRSGIAGIGESGMVGICCLTLSPKINSFQDEQLTNHTPSARLNVRCVDSEFESSAKVLQTSKAPNRVIHPKTKVTFMLSILLSESLVLSQDQRSIATP